MTEAYEKGSVKFRAKGRLLSIIGRDLISDESIAIVELVKNSYDADATKVKIKMGDLFDRNKCFIEIKDNGSGMDLQTVLTKWMEIGTTSKLKKGKNRLTEKFERPMLGERGVGRFAADKLGSHLELITRAYDSDKEIVLKIDSEKYGPDTFLEEITNEWIVRPPTDLIDYQHGTILRITKLREHWTNEKTYEQKIRNITNSLARLLSPFAGSKEFEIIFDCPDFSIREKKLDISSMVKKAPYRLEGEVNDQGTLTFSYNDVPQKPIDLRLGSIPIRHAILTRGKLDCGPFKTWLYAWDLDVKSLEKAELSELEVSLLKAKEKENRISGVNIFRDGFRIFPYGEPEDDWLGMTLRRLGRPGSYISKNQIMGFVEISHEKNPLLKDKTNREGLIEDGLAFKQLRWLLQLIVKEVALRRYKERLEKKKKIKIEGDQVIELIYETREKFKEMKDVYDEITKIQNKYELQKREIENRRKMLTQLAAFGLMAEIFTHEFSRTIRDSFRCLKKIKENTPTEDRKILDDLENSLIEMRDQLKILQPMYYAERKKTKKINIKDIFEDITKSFKTYLEKNNVTFDYKEVENRPFVAEINRGHFLMAISNLIDNSLFWLETSGISNPIILMKVDSNENTITVCDNGPGVRDDIKHHIFTPFISTKIDGRGLGLYIARNLLAAYNAEIFLVDDESIGIGGATFKIKIPSRGG